MLQLADQRVVVTGGAGFLGRHVQRELLRRGLPETSLFVPRSADGDLTRADAVEALYAEQRPDVLIHLAARVGGIGENLAHPGRVFHDNLAMGLQLIEGARRHGLRKFVQVGTTCAYPQNAPVPLREAELWDGFPEESNAPYGVAKKALFVMLDAYAREFGLRSAVLVPANLYGPGDNFDPDTSHVLPALIRRCEDARLAGADRIECWGTGDATREFLFVRDAARAIVTATERIEDPQPINLGTGRETSIRELADLVARLTGFGGEIRWDDSRPDGTTRRCLDVSLARELLGWSAEVSLEDGLQQTLEAWRAATGSVTTS